MNCLSKVKCNEAFFKVKATFCSHLKFSSYFHNNALVPHFACSGHHMLRESRSDSVSIYVQNCFDCHEMPHCMTKSNFEHDRTVPNVNESHKCFVNRYISPA